MNKLEIVNTIKQNPRFFLGTVDNGLPKVRGMLAYEINEDSIIFHTAKTKDVFLQLIRNSNCELCFACNNGMQIRIIGNVEEINSDKLLLEIFNHPSREFLRKWKSEGLLENINEELAVFKFHYNKALVWSMDTNFESKNYINMK